MWALEQSPSWEANRFSASQEILHILWNLKFHYHIHSAHHLSLFSASSIQSTTLTSHFLKIHLNIVIPSTSGSSLRFPHQNAEYASFLHHLCYKPHPSYYSRFYHPKILCEEYRSLSSLYSFIHSPVTSSLRGPNILLNTTFSNTHSL
jgi:hypothetical protein